MKAYSNALALGENTQFDEVGALMEAARGLAEAVAREGHVVYGR